MFSCGSPAHLLCLRCDQCHGLTKFTHKHGVNSISELGLMVNSIPELNLNSGIGVAYLKINGIDKFGNGIEACYKKLLIHKLIYHLIYNFLPWQCCLEYELLGVSILRVPTRVKNGRYKMELELINLM